MKANELRIGNYLESYSDSDIKSSYCKITGITNTGKIWFIPNPQSEECAWNIERLKPIPLTEEWLIKFGFDTWKDCFNNVYHVLNGFEMENINTYCGVGNSQEIKYVHQLQNLYFALTGEELTVKQEL